MNMISQLPEGKPVIGTRQVEKGIDAGKIKKVVVARNCPDFLLAKIGKVSIEKFDGTQKDLGTKIGKPFPVAVIGYTQA